MALKLGPRSIGYMAGSSLSGIKHDFHLHKYGTMYMEVAVGISVTDYIAFDPDLLPTCIFDLHAALHYNLL